MTRRGSPGDDDIRQVYRETIDALYGYVSRHCDGDRDLAEDVTQETWLRAVKAWRASGLPESPIAWLTTVAGRLLANHFRRAVPARLDDGSGDTVPAREPSGPADERRSLVERALARLPALQARLLEAFHFEKQSVAQIAAAHGLTERATEGRLRRAREKLRHAIERDPAAASIERGDLT